MNGRQKFNFNPPKISAMSDEIAGKPTQPDAPGSNENMLPLNDTIDITKSFQKMNSVEDKEKHLFEIRFIFRKQIRTNKKNKYPQDHLDSMKDSILRFGLQQNLTVAYLEGEDIYVLEAGHTRTRALDELIEEFSEYTDKDDERYQLYLKNVHEYKVKGYPCMVASSIKDTIPYDYDEATDLSDIPDEVIDSEIRLIVTNEVNRNRTPAVIAENVNRLDALYKRKNIHKSSNKEKINVNRTIADNLGITDRQVKYYKALNNLIPELKEEFENNNITLTDSAGYAKLSDEEQRTILSLLQSGHKVRKEEISMLLREKKELTEKLTSKDDRIKQLEREKQDILSQKHDDSDTADILNEKDTEISNLRKELDALKKRQQNVSKTTLTKEQSLIAKYDMKTRALFESAKKTIKDYLEAVENLCSIAEDHKEDANALGTLSKCECNTQIRDIIELLTSALKEET